MSCGSTGMLERLCPVAELDPSKAVQRLLDVGTTDHSLRKIPGHVAHKGARLSCATLAEGGQQEASNAARQTRLQFEQEHEQRLTSCHHAHQVPILVFQLSYIFCAQQVVYFGVLQRLRFVTVVRANRLPCRATQLLCVELCHQQTTTEVSSWHPLCNPGQAGR